MLVYCMQLVEITAFLIMGNERERGGRKYIVMRIGNPLTLALSMISDRMGTVYSFIIKMCATNCKEHLLYKLQ